MSVARAITLPFRYTFSQDGRLEEVGQMENSSSPYFWVSSGAFLDIKLGLGATNHGLLAETSKWRLRYAASNPRDTENGYRPQNIFRMVQRTKQENVRLMTSFKIDAYNVSMSPQRNASNGIFQMTMYQDQDNLFYTGLRVDGYAVIKKKLAGRYTTMVSKRYFTGTYDGVDEPNLLPIGTWIRLKTEVRHEEAGMRVMFFVDVNRTGTWKLAAEAFDPDSVVLARPGYTGIRTDFMDAKFDDYALEKTAT